MAVPFFIRSRAGFGKTSSSHQRKFFRVLNPFQVQIHIKFRPVKMIAVEQFDGEQLLECRAAKPRKIIERKEVFPLVNEQPEAVRRHVQDFSF